MATRDLIVDFTRGTGGEPVYGYVTVQRTVDTENGTITLLPFIQRYELRDGTVTIPALVTNGSPPVYNSGYRIYAYDYQNRPQGGVLVAIPDGTGTVNLNDLPRVTLTNGDGATVDIEQLNALIQQANDTANDAKAYYSATSNPLGGWSGSPVRFRRCGYVVTCSVSGVSGTNATSGSLCNIPLGYRPLDDNASRGLLHSTETVPRVSRTYGTTILTAMQRYDNLYGTLTWITQDAPPA